MKKILLVMTLITCLAQHTAHAHGTHGVDAPKAISIVHETVPKLTAKDFGFEVGQLDASWNAITASDISVVETDGDFYIMRATNTKTKAEIFILIGLNGKVMQVKKNNDF